MQPRTVLLARTPHPSWNWLRDAIARIAGVAVIDEVDSLAAAHEALADVEPALFVTGVAVGGCSTLPLVRWLGAVSLQTRTAVVARRANAHELAAFAATGASFLLWDQLDGPAAVQEAVASACHGQVLMAPGSPRLVPGADRHEAAAESLTDLQLEYLARLDAGQTTKEIAAALHVKESTARGNLRDIEQRAGLTNRVMLGCLIERLRQAGRLPTIAGLHPHD